MRKYGEVMSCSGIKMGMSIEIPEARSLRAPQPTFFGAPASITSMGPLDSSAELTLSRRARLRGSSPQELLLAYPKTVREHRVKVKLDKGGGGVEGTSDSSGTRRDLPCLVQAEGRQTETVALLRSATVWGSTMRLPRTLLPFLRTTRASHAPSPRVR